MPRTTPFLWFDHEAEEAAHHYVAIFPNSRIVQTTRDAEGSRESVCGWLRDRFGLSWQVVPSALPELLGGDVDRSRRVMDVILASTKLNIAALRAAADGVPAA